jgi:large subunit ribosomal protein L24
MNEHRYKIRLKKDDQVIVRSGKYKGRTGKVTATHPTLNAVTVEGINIVKHHIKPNKEYPQGGIVEQTKPISVSKVGIYEPTLKKASRIKFILKDDVKTRSYSASNKEIK